MVSKRARGISMVSDPPFTNLVQRNDRDEHDVFEGTGKGTSPVTSRILPSPILFKKVTTTKNLCALDDFLVARSFIKKNYSLVREDFHAS